MDLNKMMYRRETSIYHAEEGSERETLAMEMKFKLQ
jgi:hypothetical protein